MDAAAAGPGVDSSRTLWAGSLPPQIDERFLYSLFEPTGELVSARLIRDRHTSVSQGFAFLEFTSHAAAQRVLNAYDGKQIPKLNHVFRLNWAAFGLGRTAEGGDTTESYSLFVGDLALEVTDLVLQKHFQQFFASVNSAKVITERSTGRSKGYGFVRFSSADERDKALRCMEGHVICNRPIRVSQATAKKYQGDGLFHPSDLDPSNTTAFVGNVNAEVTEEDLSQLFRRCGEIVSIKLLRAKGCAFVTYVERRAAERAIQELHGKVIRNCAIRLCWGRRNSQPRGQLQAVDHLPQLAGYQQHPDLRAFPAHMQGGYAAQMPLWAQAQGLPREQAYAGYGLLPGMPQGIPQGLPQASIFDAALQAASYSSPLAFPDHHQQHQVMPYEHMGLSRVVPPPPPAEQAAAAAGMPDALQAFAQLSLGRSPSSAPLQ